MSTWRDAARWARWLQGDGCPICEAVATAPAVAELEASRLMMTEEGSPMRGYAWLPARRHVIELHDFDADEGAAYMRDLQRVSCALQAATGAVKMNLELHGNTVPHLHVHVFPRFPGDPWEGRPIAPKEVREPVYAPGEFAALRERVRASLAASAGPP